MKVSLKSETSGFWHAFLEILLGKWQWVKNNPRGNFLVLKALWISVVPVLLVLLFVFVLNWLFDENTFINGQFESGIFTFSNCYKFILPLLAVVVIIYWNIWKDFHLKWTYCCGLFSEILKVESNTDIYQKLRINLAVDLLVVDLWAHRSFREHFYIVCKEAIDDIYNDCELYEKLKKFEAGGMTETEVFEILNNYQIKST